ncbi:MAG TPA: hypothetical protein VN176_01705 [Verrucomicrobiae bacterium]|nr:hypothetical protein [Verrucomicrobiae bacterium]
MSKPKRASKAYLDFKILKVHCLEVVPPKRDLAFQMHCPHWRNETEGIWATLQNQPGRTLKVPRPRSASQERRVFMASLTIHQSDLDKPCYFEFDSVHRVLRWSMTGHITDEDLLECYKAAAHQVQQTNPAAAILDLTRVTSSEVSSGAIQNIAAGDPVLPDPTRPQVIVAPSDHLYGISRMYQLLGEHTRPGLRVVRSMAEAYAVIGLERPNFEPIPRSG